MENLFKEIVKHLSSKKDYFDTFIEYKTRMEGWIEGEILWLLNQKSIQDQYGVAIISAKKGGEVRPDLVLRLNTDEYWIELKALVVEHSRRTLRFYFSHPKQLPKDFKKLADSNGWLIVVAYPCCDDVEWGNQAKRAESKYQIRIVQKSVFKTDTSNRSVLISLWSAI